MKGWDMGEAPEPSEEALARVRAGRNPLYSAPGSHRDDPDIAAVLLRYREAVAQATEQAIRDLLTLIR